LLDHGAGEHEALPGRERLQQQVFAPRQRDLPAGESDALRAGVDLEVRDTKRLSLVDAVAAQEGADAGPELRKVEWLGEVVVRTYFQTTDAIVETRSRREHQDGNGASTHTQPPADVPAIHTGKHQVEEDERESPVRCHLQPGRAVRRDLDRI